MLITCPACEKQMRIRAEKYIGKKISVKCVRCSAPFKTEVISPKTQPKRRILVAHSDSELRKAVTEVLKEENFDFSVCGDGDETLALMDKNPPDVLLVDVALPGLFAFEVVEKVRQRPGLANVKIILLSSVFNKMAYKRRPETLYGADDYLEKHHVVDQITDKVHRLFDPVAAAPPMEAEPAATKNGNGTEQVDGAADGWDYIQEVNNRLLAAEEKEISPGTDGKVLEKAKRLARIIATDIALYHQERVDSGIRNGNFYDVMKDEIAEGKKHFLERYATLTNAEGIFGDAFETFISRRRAELT